MASWRRTGFERAAVAALALALALPAAAEHVTLVALENVDGDSEIPGYARWIIATSAHVTLRDAEAPGGDSEVEITRDTHSTSSLPDEMSTQLHLHAMRGDDTPVLIDYVETREEGEPLRYGGWRLEGCVYQDYELFTQEPPHEVTTLRCSRTRSDLGRRRESPGSEPAEPGGSEPTEPGDSQAGGNPAAP